MLPVTYITMQDLETPITHRYSATMDGLAYFLWRYREYVSNKSMYVARNTSVHAAHPVPTPHLLQCKCKCTMLMLGNGDALTRSSGGVNYVSWVRYHGMYSTITMDSSLVTNSRIALNGLYKIVS